MRKPADHEVERRSIRAGATFDVPYIVMSALSAVIASYGLLENSPAVVIGAMIIAMLMGPIGGTALALVDGNNKDLARSIITLLCGIIVFLGQSRRRVTASGAHLEHVALNPNFAPLRPVLCNF